MLEIYNSFNSLNLSKEQIKDILLFDKYKRFKHLVNFASLNFLISIILLFDNFNSSKIGKFACPKTSISSILLLDNINFLI